VSASPSPSDSPSASPRRDGKGPRNMATSAGLSGLSGMLHSSHVESFGADDDEGGPGQVVHSPL
jgi:hypothetical protein